MTETLTPSDNPRRLRIWLGRLGLLRESRVGMLGTALVLFWVLTALLAPLLAPYSPTANLTTFALPGAAAPDGGTFWLGTDHIGRDILSRIM